MGSSPHTLLISLEPCPGKMGICHSSMKRRTGMVRLITITPSGRKKNPKNHYFVSMSTKNKLFFKNTVIAGSGPCWLFPAPATVPRTQGLPPSPARGAGAARRGTEVLSPGLISPSSCITAAKFRCFTRNYHPQPSAPGLSEQVNDLSPGLCPRVTAISAALPAAKGLSPHTEERFSSSPLRQKATRDPQHALPTGSAPQQQGSPPEGTATVTPSQVCSAKRGILGKHRAFRLRPARSSRSGKEARGAAGSRQRRCRGLPDKPRLEAPAPLPKRFPSSEPKACQDASRPASSRRGTHRGRWI